MAMNIGMGIAMIVGVRGHVLGYVTPLSNTKRPIDDEPGQYVLASKIQLIVQLQQTIALGCIKLSFLFFYRRIFCTVKASVFGRVTQTMIGLTIVWTVAFFIASTLRCGRHFNAAFGSKEDVSAKCGPIFVIEDSLAISDFLFDVIIILMPIPNVRILLLALVPRIANPT
ncbi:MAG: hypothetical protein Q9170_007031 [Blastenia crenularia]